MTQLRTALSFPRARKLHGPHAFDAVFAYKCAATGALFQVYAKPNGTSHPRLGVVVSKRLMPRAVDRNYYKRLAREVFRSTGGGTGVDFVVRPRVAIGRASARTARAELSSLLERARLKCAAVRD